MDHQSNQCKYLGCTETAMEYAVGGDQEGGEHVYHVCLEHAKEMEPFTFGEKGRLLEQPPSDIKDC